MIYKAIVLTILTMYSSVSTSGESEVSIGSNVYNWNEWDCYDYASDKHLLSIGYIDWLVLDESDKKRFISRIKIDKNENISKIGIMFLNNSKSAIYSDYFLRGTRHSWNWDDYAITIKPSGIGHYYDFTGLDNGENVESSDTYKCIEK